MTVSPFGFLIALWGIGGVLALIARALMTLTPIAWQAVTSGALTPLQWVLLVLWVGTNAYAEGYRGFHTKFSPRVVDRALYLARHPSFFSVLVAPLFCMGLFRSHRRTMISSWILLLTITALVITIRAVPQPWRGLIDAGVVVGLALGSLSVAWLFVSAVRSGREPTRHDVPDP